MYSMFLLQINNYLLALSFKYFFINLIFVFDQQHYIPKQLYLKEYKYRFFFFSFDGQPFYFLLIIFFFLTFDLFIDLLKGNFALSATRDKDNCTAIIWAARGGHLPCLQYLVEHGADVNAVDKEGRIAISYASRYGHVSCVEYLAALGAT